MLVDDHQTNDKAAKQNRFERHRRNRGSARAFVSESSANDRAINAAKTTN